MNIEDAKVINERTDYGEGYCECRFGVCIGDRVFMVGIEGYGHDQTQADRDRALCNELVSRWNDGPDFKTRIIPDLEKEVSDWRSRAEHANRCDEQRADRVSDLLTRMEEIRSKFPGSKFGYEQYAKEVHRIATEALKKR